MREHETTVRQLIVALSTIERRLREIRCESHFDERLTLVHRKQAILRELRRRRRHPSRTFVA